jgi:hypothetical protein
MTAAAGSSRQLKTPRVGFQQMPSAGAAPAGDNSTAAKLAATGKITTKQTAGVAGGGGAGGGASTGASQLPQVMGLQQEAASQLQQAKLRHEAAVASAVAAVKERQQRLTDEQGQQQHQDGNPAVYLVSWSLTWYTVIRRGGFCEVNVSLSIWGVGGVWNG